VKFKGVFEDRHKRRIAAEIEARSLEGLMNELEVREWSALYYHLMETNGDNGEAPLLKPIVKSKKKIAPEREGNLSLLNFDAVNAEILSHNAVRNDENLQEYLWNALSFYDNGFYGFVHQNLWKVLNNCDILEPHIFYYLRVCGRVLMVPLTPNESKYEHRFMATQMAKTWIETKLRRLSSLFMKDNVRCKWCGKYTTYIDPNVPTFGFTHDNDCGHCGRMYPMPSWVWDSPHGRAYSYFRSSHNSQEFDEEFEQDYEVENSRKIQEP
jgi:hypothetical protein